MIPYFPLENDVAASVQLDRKHTNKSTCTATAPRVKVTGRCSTHSWSKSTWIIVRPSDLHIN